MAINLAKGEKIDLRKTNPTLDRIRVGLGWDQRATDGADFDLDASVFMLEANGKVVGETNFVFYGNKVSPCGSVKHNGDNLTGAGDGDDETIDITLNKVPDNIQKLVFAVSIHEGKARNQNFGQVENAFMRILDLAKLDANPQDASAEQSRYDLTEDFSTQTSVIFGEIYRKDGSWRFGAVGEGYADGLDKLLERYGLSAK